MKNKVNPDRDKIILKRNLNTWIDRIKKLWVGIAVIYFCGGMIPSQHYGGTPKYEVDGKYYLKEKRTITEVSKDVYEFVGWVYEEGFGIPLLYSFIFAPIMVILVIWRNSILPGLGKRRAKLGNVRRSKNKTVLRWQTIFKNINDRLAIGGIIVFALMMFPGRMTKPQIGYSSVLVFALILLSVKIGQLLMATFIELRYHKRLNIDILISLFLCVLAVPYFTTITGFILVH